MTFFERYAKLCEDRGIDPCSQKAAEAIGVTRATISSWNKKNTTPNGETVAVIAKALNVSSDYLLGRTDDPTDYSDDDLIASIAGPVLDHFNGDVKKAVAFQRAVAEDAARERKQPEFIKLYSRLDDVDKAKAEAFMNGLLAADKYQSQTAGKKNA